MSDETTEEPGEEEPERPPIYGAETQFDYEGLADVEPAGGLVVIGGPELYHELPHGIYRVEVTDERGEARAGEDIFIVSNPPDGKPFDALLFGVATLRESEAGTNAPTNYRPFAPDDEPATGQYQCDVDLQAIVAAWSDNVGIVGVARMEIGLFLVFDDEPAHLYNMAYSGDNGRYIVLLRPIDNETDPLRGKWLVPVNGRGFMTYAPEVDYRTASRLWRNDYPDNFPPFTEEQNEYFTSSDYWTMTDERRLFTDVIPWDRYAAAADVPAGVSAPSLVAEWRTYEINTVGRNGRSERVLRTGKTGFRVLLGDLSLPYTPEEPEVLPGATIKVTDVQIYVPLERSFKALKRTKRLYTFTTIVVEVYLPAEPRGENFKDIFVSVEWENAQDETKQIRDHYLTEDARIEHVDEIFASHVRVTYQTRGLDGTRGPARTETHYVGLFGTPLFLDDLALELMKKTQEESE